MYKKIIFTLLVCATQFITAASAQNTTAAKLKTAPVTDSAAQLLCICINSYKDSITTREQLFTALQNCIQTYATPRMDALLAEDGFVQTDDRKSRAQAVRAIGQKLGRRVAADCAGVQKLLQLFTNDAPPKALH